MKIYSEINLENFDAWSGGERTLEALTLRQLEQLEYILEDAYPDGMTDTALNDILRFEKDWIAELLGFRDWDELVYGEEDDDDDELEEDYYEEEEEEEDE